MKLAVICGDISVEPFRATNGFPAQRIAGIDANHFKQQPLCTSISISKWMDDVEFTVVVCQSAYELRSWQSDEIGFLRKLLKICFFFGMATVDASAGLLAPKGRCASPSSRRLAR